MHFNRQGYCLNELWRLSKCNNEFAICSSYPDRFVVPATISDESLIKAASQRSSQRIPVLNYIITLNYLFVIILIHLDTFTVHR